MGARDRLLVIALAVSALAHGAVISGPAWWPVAGLGAPPPETPLDARLLPAPAAQERASASIAAAPVHPGPRRHNRPPPCRPRRLHADRLRRSMRTLRTLRRPPADRQRRRRRTVRRRPPTARHRRRRR